jgi:mannose-1-phosphate guanylyltransferase / mannose-6-phosphate isomerase
MRDIGVKARAIVIEPAARNTAPAAAAAAMLLDREEAGDFVLILPSDHLIRDVPAFHAAVERGAALSPGRLTCFGVKPRSPNTGYGYVEKGAALTADASSVMRFVEKPAPEIARRFLEDGRHVWNAGIFLFPAGQFLELLGRTRPAMLSQCRAAVTEARRDLDFLRLASDSFAAIEGDSIDYAIMEHTTDAAVVDLDAGWSDVGSWSALYEESERDAAGNVVIGNVDVTDSRNSYIRSDKRLLAAIGVENLVVVAVEDAVLVIDRRHDQAVKALVQGLKDQKKEEATRSARAWRPWGWFESLEEGDRFQVKRLLVEPGHSLSLQLHRHRSEHWVVVAGVAEVTRGDETYLIGENESTFIPAGTRHRLRNPGDGPLHVIEIQSGDYCGEDDIVRFTDEYGRAGNGD